MGEKLRAKHDDTGSHSTSCTLSYNRPFRRIGLLATVGPWVNELHRCYHIDSVHPSMQALIFPKAARGREELI